MGNEKRENGNFHVDAPQIITFVVILYGSPQQR